MTPRRGSLHYKIVRLSRLPREGAAPTRKRSSLIRRAAAVAGRLLVLLAIVFASGTMAAQIWHVGERNLQLHDQIARAERANQDMQAINDRLATRVDRLRDPEYLVPLIHEQLGLVKPNEVFIETTPATPAPAPHN